MAEVGGRRMVAVVLQSSVSLAVGLHGLPLTLERATYQSSNFSIFCHGKENVEVTI